MEAGAALQKPTEGWMLEQGADERPQVRLPESRIGLDWSWQGALAETQVHMLSSCLVETHSSSETTLHIVLTAAPSSPRFSINAMPELCQACIIYP